MAKVKAFTTSQGDKNSYMLLQPDSEMPQGYTAMEPPEATEGHKVAWNGAGWEQQPLPESETQQ